MITPRFFNPVLEMFCNFVVRLNIAGTQTIGVMCPKTEKQIN